MPHPREAIYDVLSSKARKEKEAAELERLWKQYEEQNRRASDAVHKS